MPPRTRPATTGYERLAQADRFSDDESDDDSHHDAALGASFASLQPAAAPRYAPITQPRPHSGMNTPKPGFHRSGSGSGSGSGSKPLHYQGGRRRVRSNSGGVDLKAINARLERWADEIAAKFKRSKKKTGEEEPLEIHHSVFQAPEGVRPITAEALAAPESSPKARGLMTKEEFDVLVDGVRTAIERGVHPRMISQGSSGSYFARDPEGRVVGVFKPKDEEPYAAGNPKWNKWIHRNLFPCCFGRACLIPNLSYVSEAAAYVLDCQLRTRLVPYTEVVYLSSKSFHYPFWDRYSYSRNRKPLPAKPGSFQVFLKGFKDANVFLREHPWPDQYLSGFRTVTTDRHRTGSRRKKRWADNCRPTSRGPGQVDGDSDDEESGEGTNGGSPASLTPGPDNFVWTETLKQSFREELEKLVILDYIMRNTDRGLDNWMIKVDWSSQEVSIASEPLRFDMMSTPNGRDEHDDRPRPVDLSQRAAPESRASYPTYRAQKPMNASSPPADGSGGGARDPKISIGAIDNSLSWPWKHPDAWRSFPFGWLFLPVDLIGRPFSQRTRDHFLPLLTSTAWWSQTQQALRRVFQVDPDFQERMFARQLAVMKGQAWNVVETLKTPDHGPLELTRRAKVCVWDDLVDVPVAVPMRATASSETSRRSASDFGANKGGDEDQEEMDIGAVKASASGPISEETEAERRGDLDLDRDLLDMASPPAALPHPGRFELSSSSEPPLRWDDSQSTPAGSPRGAADVRTGTTPPRHHHHHYQNNHQHRPTEGRKKAASSDRPRLPRSGAGASSYQGPLPRSLNMYAPQQERERRYSFVTAAAAAATAMRRNSSGLSGSGGGGGDPLYGYGYDEDVDGDLGYAAAEGMEGNRRKVIVERLEAVKTKNPVFTCC